MLVYIILIRLNTLIYPVAYQLKPSDGYLNEVFFTLLSNPLSQSIVAIVLIYIQALVINRIGIKHKLNKNFGLLPGVFYALFISLVPLETALTPILIANTFVIISLQYIITTYNKREVSRNVFSSGMYATLGSLFYFPYLYFFVVTTIGLLIMRSFSFKERLQHMIGWVLPYLLIWVWHFWSDNESPVIPNYFQDQYSFLNVGQIEGVKLWAFVILFVVFILVFLTQYLTFSSKKEITTQKKIDIFYWVMLYGGISILFYNHLSISHFFVVALPFGYFLAMSIVNIKNVTIRELVHFLLIAGVIYNHYL